MPKLLINHIVAIYESLQDENLKLKAIILEMLR